MKKLITVLLVTFAFQCGDPGGDQGFYEVKESLQKEQRITLVQESTGVHQTFNLDETQEYLGTAIYDPRFAFHLQSSDNEVEIKRVDSSNPGIQYDISNRVIMCRYMNPDMCSGRLYMEIKYKGKIKICYMSLSSRYLLAKLQVSSSTIRIPDTNIAHLNLCNMGTTPLYVPVINRLFKSKCYNTSALPASLGPLECRSVEISGKCSEFEEVLPIMTYFMTVDGQRIFEIYRIRILK